MPAPLPAPPAARDPAAIIDWLLREGREVPDIPALVDAFCRRLIDAGVPLWRGVWALQLLHPQIRSMLYYWRRGRQAVETVTRPHGTEVTEAYLTNPFAALIEDQAEGLRYRLEVMEPPWPYPILGELRAQGATDYVAMALLFTGGRRNAMSFASDRPGGFSTGDLALLDAALPALGAVLEAMVLRRLAATVLDTYVGHRTGARILSGDIRRGTGANVRAVLWYCDLRGFTPLADRLPREELIALLNGYFESMGGAVEAHGGEILKFVGDAMLALFPLEDGDSDGARAAAAALDAATDALARMDQQNAERAAWGQPVLECGIALHLGEVMYGNIGSATRLDFTIIGPAVNLVTRIEGLCERLGQRVLASAAVAAALPPGGRSRHVLAPLGAHPVKGLRDPVAVFGLAGTAHPHPHPHPALPAGGAPGAGPP
ncbi:adenylate/guanylate cyclase domain-containing protein [Azospirillum thermophilum]|uniref:Adenylate/guanylate cyclase domain-containing protein n=1 Tax=Azospirillum thermophilum TaxID=2202148 RepID=A0A2S2CTV8_9PROT|nr:adenylate/guanylate cyclase domain-containing protein [Azospirillum thermophilum]